MKLQLLFGHLALAFTVPVLAGCDGNKPNRTISQGSDLPACALASKAAAAFLSKASPSAVPSILPSLALACVQSVPVDVPRDIAQTKYFAPFFELQSTTGYLKDPPEGYLLPGVDLLGGLNEILAKLTSGAYTSQFQWALDLHNLFVQASDGHFAYTPGLLGVFRLQQGIKLISVSEDGTSIPEVFGEEDLKAAYAGFNVSSITHLNDIPIADYLEITASSIRLQDPDAKYNALFDSIPYSVTGTGNWFNAGGYASLPDETHVKYANGSKAVFKNYAVVLQNLTGILTGEDLHIAYEIPPPASNTTGGASSKREISATSATTTIPTAAAQPMPTLSLQYPPNVVCNEAGYFCGYFLNGTYNDTAVLAITSFKDQNAAPGTDFRQIRAAMRKFLTLAKTYGKTKLVIDMSANPGGLLLSGFELYKNLFPQDTRPWSGARVRAIPSINFVGETTYAANITTAVLDAVTDVDGKPFPSWQALYGPEPFPQGNETNLMLLDFSVPQGPVGPFNASTSLALMGFDPTDTDAPTVPLFKPENIVVASDGFCSSTCGTFVGLLQREQGVRVVALGGRPQLGPMQGVGGVKGATVLQWQAAQQVTSLALSLLPKLGAEAPPIPGDLPDINPSPLLPRTSDASGGSFNYKNAYSRRGEGAMTPLQFVYEAANCRRFYTPATAASMTRLWEDVADVAWRGAKCVEGSTVNSDGTIGNATVPYSPAVRSRVLSNPAWPGSLTYKQSGNVSSGGMTKFVGRRAAPIPRSKMELWYREPKLPERSEWWYRG